MWSIARYELLKLLRTKSVVALLFIAPLVLIFILGSALADVFQVKDQAIEPVKLAVYDEDKGAEIGFHDFLSSLEKDQILRAEQLNSRDGVVKQIKNGKSDMGLYIPRGFYQAMLEGKAAEWEIIRGSDRIKNLTGQIILESFTEEANRVQATSLVLGPKAAVRALGTGQQTEEKTDYVKNAQLTKSKQEYTAIQYYSASMLIMFLLFGGLTAAISLIREKESYTLSRLQAAPVSTIRIISGKLLGNGLLAAIQAMIIILITKWVYGVDWGVSNFYLILIMLLTIFSSMGLAFIVAFLFKTTKTISAAFSSFIGIMTFISGGMSPLNGTFLEKVQPFTLNHWAFQSILNLMLDQDFSKIIYNLSILAIMGSVFLIIAFGLYRKAGYHE